MEQFRKTDKFLTKESYLFALSISNHPEYIQLVESLGQEENSKQRLNTKWSIGKD